MNSVVAGKDLVAQLVFFNSSGSLIDPTTPRIDLVDPNNSVVVSQATPVRDAQGLYHFSWPVPLDALLGNWRVRLTAVINGQFRGPIEEVWEVLPVGMLQFQPSVAYTYDIGTDVGRVRLWIDDRDMSRVSTSLPLEARSAIFTDGEIQSFLDSNGGDVLYASAQGLITIAGNRSLLVISRKIGREDVEYGSIRADLLKQASALVAMASQQPADGYAAQAVTDPAMRLIIIDTQLRQGF